MLNTLKAIVFFFFLDKPTVFECHVQTQQKRKSFTDHFLHFWRIII